MSHWRALNTFWLLVAADPEFKNEPENCLELGITYLINISVETQHFKEWNVTSYSDDGVLIMDGDCAGVDGLFTAGALLQSQN